MTGERGNIASTIAKATPNLLSADLTKPALIAALAVLTAGIFGAGVAPNDSMKYLNAALVWHHDGPQLGETHWSLRYPLVLAIVASFAAFGVSEFASLAPNYLYAAALVAVTFHFARKHLGDSAGLAASALVASSPYLLVTSLGLDILGPEIFFGALACWLFLDGAGDRIKLRSLAGASAAAGAAWLCREIAIYLPATFALILMLRRPFRLDALVAVCGVFGLVVMIELAAYWMIAGDPFYRLTVDFGHRGPGHFFAMPRDAPSNPLLARLVTPLIKASTWPVASPFMALGALTLAHRGFRRALFTGPHRAAWRLFAAASLISFFSSAYGANLKSPQYYPILVYTATLLTGAFAAFLYEKSRRRVALAIFAGAVALNWAVADFRRYDEHAEARLLAAYAMSSETPVMTDGSTATRARMFLQLNGVTAEKATEKILSAGRRGEAPCGVVYAATPRRGTPRITPGDDWRRLWSATPRRERATVALARLLVGGTLPQGWADQLNAAGPVALYVAPACAGVD